MHYRMSGILKALSQRSGKFEGEGINHEGSRFIGRLEISPVIDGHAIQIAFQAQGMDGTLLHQERSTIAYDPKETLCLWSVHSNHPKMTTHELRSEGVSEAGSLQTLVFGHGALEDRSVFREEITVEIWNSGEVGYRYAWGMPGGDFSARSSVKLSPEM